MREKDNYSPQTTATNNKTFSRRKIESLSVYEHISYNTLASTKISICRRWRH